MLADVGQHVGSQQGVYHVPSSSLAMASCCQEAQERQEGLISAGVFSTSQTALLSISWPPPHRTWNVFSFCSSQLGGRIPIFIRRDVRANITKCLQFGGRWGKEGWLRWIFAPEVFKSGRVCKRCAGIRCTKKQCAKRREVLLYYSEAAELLRRKRAWSLNWAWQSRSEHPLCVASLG